MPEDLLIEHHGDVELITINRPDKRNAISDAVIAQLRAAVVRAHRAEMAKAEAEAELSRMRDELIGTVSHELRTPLASVLGAAEALRHGREGLTGIDEAQGTHGRRGEASGAHLHELPT